MREIKFRAWDPREKIMRRVWTDLFYVDHRILMQYTGLKDKDGKEIYEGDIIQAIYPKMLEPLMKKRGGKYEIVFRLGSFKAFDLATKDGDIEDDFLHAKSFNSEHLRGYEIIGNIYENPDLLK